MFDKTRVGQAVLGDFSAPKGYAGWTKVVLQVDDNLAYTAGDDTGRTLTACNPFGTQEMAEKMLASLRGSAYQPYSGTTALLDPAAELGDAVDIRGYYGGIYSLTRNLDKLYTADISAPSDEEVDHEYPYKSSQERAIVRERKQTKASLQVLTDRITAEVEAREGETQELRASLSIQADRITQEVTARAQEDAELRASLEVQAGQISAKVSKNGGNRDFGWNLTDSAMVWTANGAETVRFDRNGAYIRRKIEALTGKIGGFSIESDYLSYNGQTWGGTNSWGGYFGSQGLQLGRDFRVDMSGNLYAASGKFSGEVSAGNIQYGGDNGTLWGEAITQDSISGGWGGQITSGGVSTYNTTDGINASLASADFAEGVFNGWNEAPEVAVGSLKIDGHYLNRASISIGGSRYKLVTWI